MFHALPKGLECDASLRVACEAFNLISKGAIPPVVCVFVGNGGGDYIGSERGLEYDTVSGLYATWVDTELLPRIEMESKTTWLWRGYKAGT